MTATLPAGVRAVLFDLDGVLTPTVVLHRRAWARTFEDVAERVGLTAPMSPEEYLRHVDGKPRYDGVRDFLAARGTTLAEGVPADDPDQLTVCGIGNRKDALFNELLATDGIAAYPGVGELLATLRQRSIACAVVSSSANARSVLSSCGLAPLFDVVVDAAEARSMSLAGKPSPDTFLAAADLLGLVPSDCAVVEDAVSGVAAGRAGGFAFVVGVDRGAGPLALSEAGADVVLAETAHLREHLPAAGDDPMDRSRYPDDPWGLHETRFDPAGAGVAESLFAVGNGYLGMRANPEEGRDAHAHGTFVNGFHETWPIAHAEDAFGFARTGQSIVHVPDAKTIRLYVDDEPLLLSDADLPFYERSLDFRDGVLRRTLVWRTSSGRRVRVASTRTVSLTDRHLAVMTYEVTLLDGDAPVVISSVTLNRQDGQDEYHVPGAAMGEGLDPRRGRAFDHKVLEPQGHWVRGDRASLAFRCARSGMTLGVGVDHRLQTDSPATAHDEISPERARRTWRISGRAGEPIKVTKLVAYHSSRGVPADELVERCENTLDRARDVGVDEHHARQRQWLAQYWDRSDVQAVGAGPGVQQAVRWNLFQLAQAAACAGQAGIAAKGVTGSGYDGHYFWDTEVYVLPFWTFTDPRVSRAALRFRYAMLPAARRRAAEVAQAGALFPWRTISGDEASAYYAAGTAQYHIDADVSYAVEQYLRATGDTEFLACEAIDILVETARMWADLGFWRSNGGDSFHIHGVTGPDEYTTVVNDNLFTNVMARFNLRAAAVRVSELAGRDPAAHCAMVARLGLEPGEVEEWRRAADAMHVPFEESLGVHPQDAGFLQREVWDLAATPADRRPLLLNYHPLVIYRFQVLKQADAVMALFLASDEFTDAEKLADFEYYDPLTTGDSSLSGVAQSIIAAEVGYADLAMSYFTGSLFLDLANLHHNTADGVHVAAAGGVWQTLVCGFGGMRETGGALRFDPRLPATWQSLVFHLTVRGSRLRIEITADELQATLLSGPATSIEVRGQHVAVAPGVPARVELAGQGDVRHAPPTSPALSGVRRADGTLITASVPDPKPR